MGAGPSSEGGLVVLGRGTTAARGLRSLGLAALLFLFGIATSGAQEGTFIRGDADGSGDVGLSDSLELLAFLFAGGSDLPCFDASDFDDDGELIILDALAILSFVFQSGPPPLPPYPDCGIDPTADRLSCSGPVVGCPRPKIIPPRAPMALAVSETQIDFSWEDTTDSETGFEVERSFQGREGPFDSVAVLPSDSSSYSDTDLAPMTEACYRVRALFSSGSSVFTDAACATTLPPTPPAPPSGLEGHVVSHESVSLRWQDNSDNETGFEIERSADGPTGSFLLVATTPTDSEIHDDIGLEPATEYCYRVRAVTRFAMSDYSSVVCVTTAPPPPPPAPENLLATAASTTAIDLQWEDNAADETGFEIERSTDGGKNFGLLAVVSADTTDYADSSLEPSTEYCYRVRALRESVSSDYSNLACSFTNDLVPEPHNVVFILIDDVGVDLIGAYEKFYEGHPPPSYPNTTPVIDYLADTGMLFRHAWTHSICSPTRAQILTGQQGFRSGVGTAVNGTPDPMGLQQYIDTIPSMLRSSNAPVPYHTAALGKWHLASSPGQHPPPDGRFHALGSAASPWFLQYAGRHANLDSQNYNSWTKTFGTSIIPGVDECTPLPGSYCERLVTDYATVDTTDDAIHLVQTMPEPFFLYVAYNAAHTPLNPPDVPLPGSSCHDGLLEGDPDCSFGFGPAKIRCMVQQLDSEIGRLLCTLEDSPGMPDLPTTIVLMGDNGTSGNAILEPFDNTHGKGTEYEGGIGVPFIVKSPVIPPELVGSVSEALICSTDVFATVSDLSLAPPPPDPHQLRESFSFVPVLAGLEASIREYNFAEHFGTNFAPTPEGNPPAGWKPLGAHRRAIRNLNGFKLLQYVSRDGEGGVDIEEQLYDLNADPHEQNDLIGLINQSPYQEQYADLRNQLDVTYPHLQPTD